MENDKKIAGIINKSMREFTHPGNLVLPKSAEILKKRRLFLADFGVQLGIGTSGHRGRPVFDRSIVGAGA